MRTHLPHTETAEFDNNSDRGRHVDIVSMFNGRIYIFSDHDNINYDSPTCDTGLSTDRRTGWKSYTDRYYVNSK